MILLPLTLFSRILSGLYNIFTKLDRLIISDHPQQAQFPYYFLSALIGIRLHDATELGDSHISMEREGQHKQNNDGGMGVFRSIDTEIPPISWHDFANRLLLFTFPICRSAIGVFFGADHGNFPARMSQLGLRSSLEVQRVCLAYN
jgi:hypothetical protein